MYVTLNIWFENIETREGPYILIQASMPFGFTAAPGVVELSIFKFIWKKARDHEIRTILDNGRFADNVIASGRSQEDLMRRGEELKRIFSEYSLFFKDATELWRQMPQDDPRRSIQTENLYGYTWDLERDTLQPAMELTINGMSRGRNVKPNLLEKFPKPEEISQYLLSVLTTTIVTVDGCLSAPCNSRPKSS